MNTTQKETLIFQSEIKQLLHLMINSLYSNKEIFLRELISNAADAADKLRFRALSNAKLYEKNSQLYVRISLDKPSRTLTISDNGIGMTRSEIIDNLGTIAKSGTKDFLKSISTNQDKTNQLIGQFGVGFYSVFIVANKVLVKTRAAGCAANQGVLWESSGEGEYSLSNIIKADRGTDIILYLKPGEDEFLEEVRLRNIISKYSDHISLPVEIQSTNKDNNVIWEQINKAQALWIRNKSDIRDSEYKEFYKYITHDVNDPLIWSHNRVEGKPDYISLLYVPTNAMWDIWNREQKHGLKLYVRRVFIMDDAIQFMPHYLRFIRGLIDSNDLPLNVSREILQDNQVTTKLRKSLIKRVLQMLEKLSQDIEQYNKFWKAFGLVMKEGPAEDQHNKENIVKLLRFSTTKSNSSEQTVSLDQYVSRMIKDQEKIFYITADSYAAAKGSPHLEFFYKQDIEVLLLFDRIDEWMMSYITAFNGKQIQSVSKVDDSLNKIANDEVSIPRANKASFQSFIRRVKNVLGDSIKEVRVTNRLTDTPAIVVTDKNEMSTQMAKLFTSIGQSVPAVKYILELNCNHDLVKRIIDIEDELIFRNWVKLLLEQALLVEKGSLDDPNKFIQRINKLLIS